MAEYAAAYKCRLCGEIFPENSIKGKSLEDFTITNILSQMEQTLILNRNNRADLHKFHKCKDGSMGFCDFQGFKKAGE